MTFLLLSFSLSFTFLLSYVAPNHPSPLFPRSLVLRLVILFIHNGHLSSHFTLPPACLSALGDWRHEGTRRLVLFLLFLLVSPPSPADERWQLVVVDIWGLIKPWRSCLIYTRGSLVGVLPLVVEVQSGHKSFTEALVVLFSRVQSLELLRLAARTRCR